MTPDKLTYAARVMLGASQGKVVESCQFKEVGVPESGYSTDWGINLSPDWNWDVSDFRLAEDVIKYRRYISAETGLPPFDVLIATHPESIETVEASTGFVGWIDNEWQGVNPFTINIS